MNTLNDDLKISIPTFKSVLNFRDAGGLPTIDGKRIREKTIFRSASPDKISKRDINKLHKLGIKSFIDLRAPHETGRKIIKIDGIVTISLPLDFERKTRERLIPLFKQKDAIKQIENLIESLYNEILDASAGILNNIIEILLEPSRCPVVIHCHAGKDRTGIICALIQMLLNADHQYIIENYMASNEALIPHYKRRLLLRNILCLGFFPSDKILFAITVRSTNIESVLNRVITAYGGIEGYLNHSDSTIRNLEKMKERYVI